MKAVFNAEDLYLGEVERNDKLSILVFKLYENLQLTEEEKILFKEVEEEVGHMFY